jgi:hypothetical protein
VFVRHNAENFRLLDEVVKIHIEQTFSSTFKLIQRFPSVGGRWDKPGRYLVKGAPGRDGYMQFSYGVFLIQDKNHHRFCLTMDYCHTRCAPPRPNWNGWLSLHSSLTVGSSLNFHSSQPEQLLEELARTYLTPRCRESMNPCTELRNVVPDMTITAKWEDDLYGGRTGVHIRCF